MIAGFVEPTSGAITLEGRDLLAVKPAKRGLGIVFQSYALFPHMTVAENVAFGLEMQGVAAAERDERVARDAGAGRARRPSPTAIPRRMSGGQQQRVALARALVIRPRILLLDEPLSNLDAKLREEMQIELRQIQRTVGTTTILVTHDQAEAMALVRPHRRDEPGPRRADRPPHEAYERPATPFVASFLGKTNVLPARVGNGMCDRRRALDDGEPRRRRHRHGAAGEDLLRAPPANAVAGTVKTRIFQGNHWLYQVDTPAGLVTVIRQNTGEAVPAEGEAVHLAWRARGHGARACAARVAHERTRPSSASRRPRLPAERSRPDALSPEPAGAAAVRRRRARAARHDRAALVPRLGPVQGHRAGLHPEELARGLERRLLPRDVRAHLPHRLLRDAARRRCSARPRPTS